MVFTVFLLCISLMHISVSKAWSVLSLRNSSCLISHKTSNIKNVVWENMDKVLIYWIYVIYPTAIWLLNPGCTNTHTWRKHMLFGCFQNFIVNGTYSSNWLYWDKEAFGEVQRKGKGKASCNLFYIHKVLNGFCRICIPFSSFDPETIFSLLLSLQGKLWTGRFLERKCPPLLYSLRQYRDLCLHGAIYSKFLVKNREWDLYVHVCPLPWQYQKCFWKQESVTWEVAALAYGTQ